VLVIDVEQNSEDWFAYRKGKISGTMLGDLYSKRGTRKIGFYEIIAQRLAVDPDSENRMDRGLRLEEDAIKAYTEKTGHEVERVGICVHSDYPQIIQSPDGLVKKNGKYVGAVEAKCLSSARHLQAVIENKIPPEFEAQKCQYFIVNPDLEWLDFVFFDDRIASVPLHIIRVTRDDVDKFLPRLSVRSVGGD
jgi:YqaJ-like viral recombinase domain